MKLLVLSSRFPYPLHKGDKLRLYYQLIDLSKHFEIILFSISDEKIPKEYVDHLASFCKAVYVEPLSKAVIIKNVVKGILKSIPIHVSYFYDVAIQLKLDEVIETQKPDIIYCQLIRTSEYARGCKLPKHLDFMDCFSVNSLKRSEVSSFPLNFIWKREASQVKKYEHSISNEFNSYSIISEEDKKRIGLSTHTIAVVPNGISDYFLAATIQDQNRDIDILFTGNLSYYSNIDAIRFILHELIPSFNQSLKIAIVGAYPTHEIKNLINNHLNVTLYENVNDIRSYYLRAKVFLAPITKGTGMQNKVLEAISCGCIVICSQEVKDGLGFEVNTKITASTIPEYTDSILWHLSHFESTLDARIKSKDYIAKNYNWPIQNQKLIDLLKSI